jgi:hypothetical protein
MIIAGLCLTVGSCTDDFLDRKPLDIISDADVWGNESAILAYLADLYDNVQMETNKSMASGEGYPTHFTDESMRGYVWQIQHNPTYPDNFLVCYNDVYGLGYDDPWAYAKIRKIHEFIEKMPDATIDQSAKDRYLAEAYFLRAFNYFTMAKRYGGVPLVKEAQKYDGSNGEALQMPRSTEEETWNFIAEDLDKAIAGLPEENVSGEQFRATKYAAYALKARAMLYAGSIARYGQVQLNGLVGIPSDKANQYFNISLAASETIINSGKYKLYDKNPDDRAANYQNLFLDRTMHEEAIFVKAYSADKGHSFDMMSLPQSIGTGWCNSIGPTLELVEAYECTDGTSGTLKINDADGNPIYYDQPDDIFIGKEARFYGTILYPNATFAGVTLEIRRGIIGSDGVKMAATTTAGLFQEDPSLTLSGKGGMTPATTNTGFYLRKYMDPAGVITGQDRSTTNFLVFRYGETLLNYAEAVMELGRPNDALPKLNEIRARAGVPLKTSVTMDDIRRERRVELAFENLRMWDLIRWRTFTQVCDNTLFAALLPWLDYKTGKYVFEKAPNLLNSSKTFLEKNYYQPIPGVAQNPVLIQNPGF